MESKKNKNAEIPFPYFGAGHAEFFEWDEIVIRFTQAPGENLVQQMLTTAPQIIKLSFTEGRFMSMVQTNPADLDEAQYEGEEATIAFNADIERWLQEVHGSCPVEYVYRTEIFDGGGIDISSWHKKSIEKLPTLFSTWENDSYTYTQPDHERDTFLRCVRGILEYTSTEEKPATLPEKLLALFPDMALQALLGAGALEEAASYARQHIESEADVCFIINEAFSQYVRNEEFDKAHILADIVEAHVREEGIANQAFSLIQRGNLKAAHDILMNEYHSGKELHWASFNSIWHLFRNYQRPADELLTRLTNETEHLILNDPQYQNPKLLYNTIAYLSQNNPRRCVGLFENWIACNRTAPAGSWSIYAFAATNTRDEHVMQHALANVQQVLIAEVDTFINDTSYALLMHNSACLASLLGNKDLMIDYLVIAKKVHSDFASLQEDADFKLYWKDVDFLALFR